MAEPAERTVAWAARNRDRIAAALLLVAGATHRSWVFAAHYEPLRDLISTNPGWLSIQYLTLPALTEHLAGSLLYLQQAPPVPQVILYLTVKAFGWPYGTVYALIGFQTLLSFIATLLLYRHMRRLIGTPAWLSCAIGLVFLLSPDLLVMEYNMFGQTMYEQLAMVLVLLVIWLAVDPTDANRPARAALLGLVTAALALTRASFSYFLVLPLGLLIVRGVRHGRGGNRRLLAAFFIGLLPHAAWSAKQAVVYGTPSISTSSWAGINGANAIVRTDRGNEFVQSILNDGRYPAWVRALLGDHGYRHWHPPTYQVYLPDNVKAAQDAIQARLAGTNRQENSIGIRLLSDAYMKAGIRFRIRHPRWAAQQWLRSYDLFWRPIRDYSDQFLAPLSVFALTSSSFDLRGLWRVASAELVAANEHYAQGHELKRIRVRTRFYTIPVLGIVMLALNLITLHTLTVLLLVWALAGVVRRRRSRVLPEGFLLLIGIYAYAAFVMNIAEYGENMRFRLSVEPVIWLLSVWSLAIAWRAGRQLHADRSSGD